MGIRVNKRLGYGLVDVAYGDKGDCLDPRVNADSLLLDWDRGDEVNTSNYVEFLQHRDDKSTERYILNERWLESNQKMKPRDCVFLGNLDYGLEQVLCVTPIWMYEEWHRADDAIDWVTESYLFDSNPLDRVDVFPHGLFPFNGLYMDARNGEILKGRGIMDWIRLWTNLKPEGKAISREMARDELDDLASSFGMTHAEAEQYVVPNVPEEVRNLCEFGRLFTDSSTLLQLRPMLCTYWC
jgi:hypothetical protein